MASGADEDSTDQFISIPKLAKDRLFDGIAKGDVKRVQSVLNEYPDILSLLLDGFCEHLHLAVMYNHINICKMLLDHGACVNKGDDSCDTPLHIAIRHKTDIELIAMLIKYGSDLTISNVYGDTPLMEAVSSGSIAILKEVLSYSCKAINYQDISGQTALHILINNSNSIEDAFLQECIDLLFRAGLTLNVQDTRGHTALHLAVGYSNEILLHHLLLVGVDPCIQSDKGDNFLHTMSNYSDANAIADFVQDMINLSQQDENFRKIFDCKRLINSQNKLGKTPFHSILNSNRVPVMKLLLQYYVDITIKDNLMRTYLHSCSEESDGVDGVALVLESDYNQVNDRDVYGQSALFTTQTIEIDKLLLSKGADPNIRDKRGLTPLHHAAMSGSCSKVKLLLENGADVNSTDVNDSVPLHFASYLNFDEIADILRRYGASPDKQDNLGRTSEFLARIEKASQQNKITDSPLKCVLSDDNEVYFSLSADKCIKLLLENMTIYNDENMSQRLASELKVPHSLTNFAREVLIAPKIGIVLNSEETKAVKKVVLDLVTNAMIKVSDIDPRFAVDLLQTGSSVEGTRVGEPDEFDFLCILKNFSDICNIVEKGTYIINGFVQLSAKDETGPDFREYFGKQGKLDAEKVQSKFFSLLEIALSDKTLWISNALYGVVCVNPSYKPVMTIDFDYIGCEYKVLEISVDIVPAIYKPGWWPQVAIGDSAMLLFSDIKKVGCAVLLQHPEMNKGMEDDENNFRISCAPAEIEIFKRIPYYLKLSYALAKIFVGKTICPSIKCTKDRDGTPSTKFFISSYMLKNCLFHMIAENKDIIDNFIETYQNKDPKETKSTNENSKIGIKKLSDDDKVQNETYIRSMSDDDLGEIVKGTCEIFYRLAEFSMERKIPSYFIPVVNIFNFEDMIYHLKGEEELETRTSDGCIRRLAYLSIILHLLGRSDTATNL